MAKRLFLSLLKHYLFWILLFAISRLIFLFWNKEELNDVGAGEILYAFAKALYLDTAMASYLLAFPFLFELFAMLFQKSIFIKISLYFHCIVFFAFYLLVISELSIYDEWHTKLNYKALWFLGNPSEVFHTASWSQLVFGLLGTSAFTFGTFWVYKKYVAAKKPAPRKPLAIAIAYFILVPVLLGVGIRGGFQQIPINVSDAYYSKYNVLNLAAVNSAFNLSSSILENANAGEPYVFLSTEECDLRMNDFYAVQADSTLPILTTNRPNIVLVVLEGWSADMVQSCGGFEGVSPFFDEMAQQGILFTDCYASGGLSDQGMAAVFSAFPAQPVTSIITQPNKYEHLPCVNKQLKTAGYTTSFMFGGQLSYGNIRSYMYFNAFDKITESQDFDDDIPQGKLGVHDEYLFPRQLADLQNPKEPFFAAMFTSSTHGPFDFTPKKDLNWGEKEADYVNSIYYADQCIKEFIAGAKKEKWYNNTLFVFVSDHSHNSPKNYAHTQPEYRRIPMLFFGEVLKPEMRGMKYSETSAQTDLASTLLHQLNLPSEDFVYSKNLFNPYAKRFACYAFEEGFGIVQNKQHLVWHVDGRTEFDNTTTPQDSTMLFKNGQAYLQRVMNDYWKY